MTVEKALVLGFSLTSLLISSFAFADYQFIDVSNHWPKSNNTFSNLEQLGVRKDAELKAVNQCQQRGLQDCVSVSSELIQCNVADGRGRLICDARATARGYLPDAPIAPITPGGPSFRY
jgi:hypothetical protein